MAQERILANLSQVKEIKDPRRRAIDEYLQQLDWRVNANANQGYSLGGMILNISGKMVANYWLDHVYPREVGEAHRRLIVCAAVKQTQGGRSRARS